MKYSKLHTAAILAVVLLALGGLATWDEWQTKKDEAAEKEKTKLADFKPEDVVEFDYYATDSGADAAEGEPAAPKPGAPVEVTAVKKDGAWRLVKPVDGPADAATIEGLIKAVAEYSFTKVVSEKREQWGDFGVAEPKRKLVIRLGGDHPREQAIYLGDRAPVGYNVYFRTGADDKTYIGSQHLLIATSKTLVDFRDKTVAKIDEATVKTITYERRDEPTIELAKADGKYAITKPEALEADSVEVRDFLGDLSSLRAIDFVEPVDDALKQYFVTPDTKVTWTDEKGTSTSLSFSEKGGKLYATFDPARGLMVLPDEAKTRVRRDLLSFRDRRVFAPEELDVAAIEIDGEVFKNVAGSWYTAADADKLDESGKLKGGIPEKEKPAERSHLRAFMVDLEFAKTDRFVPLTDALATGLVEAPAHRITLTYKAPAAAGDKAATGGAPLARDPVVIDLFKRDSEGDKLILRRTGGKYLYRVPKTVIASMKPSATPPAGAATPGEEPGGFDLDEEALPMDDPALDEEGGLDLNQGQEDTTGGQDVSAKSGDDSAG